MKLNRLFDMVYLLLHKEIVPAKEFATRFDVTTRTIYRYVDELSAAGIPIYMKKGKNGGISLLPNYTLPKVMLTDREKNEILASLSAVAVLEQNNTKSTLQKLSGLFQNSRSDWLEIDFSRWQTKSITKETFDLLKKSILSQTKLRILYRSPTSDSSTRTIHPVRLLYKSMDWYLYAFCENKDDYRVFKLKRIQEITPLNDSFPLKVIPPINLDYSTSADITPLEITLKIDGNFGAFVIEEYETYHIDENGDYIVTYFVPNEDDVLPHLLSLGSSCKVLAPKSLASKIKQEIQKTLQNYL